MGRRRCCCGGCWSWSDDFNRAAIGSAWDEVAGTWATVSDGGFPPIYYLTEAGTSGAVLIMASNASPAPMHHKVLLYLENDLPVGAKPRVIVNYVDSDNYFLAEWEKTGAGAGGTGIMRLYKRTGGVNDLLLESNPYAGDAGAITVCFTEETFAATASAVVLWDWVCDPGRFANGNKAGIGNGSNEAITFGNTNTDVSRGFVITEHYSVAKPECPRCQCMCEAECIPQTLLFTIYIMDPAHPCYSCNGQQGTLVYDVSIDAWTFSGTMCYETWDLAFECNGMFSMQFTSPAICAAIIGVASDVDDESTCDPLSIKMGPFVAEGGPPEALTQHNMWLIITEVP